jgi:bifunctional DNase/RNase
MTYQFASSLLGAAGCRVDEVRITDMVEGVIYATVVVEGPTGTREVNARPSDALNLAMVTGSPIRVERHLLVDNPDVTGKIDWLDYPHRAADIAADAPHRHQTDPCR